MVTAPKRGEAKAYQAPSLVSSALWSRALGSEERSCHDLMNAPLLGSAASDWTRTFDLNGRTSASTITGRWTERASNDRCTSQTGRLMLPGELK
jgi:hypothetical protein